MARGLFWQYGARFGRCDARQEATFWTTPSQPYSKPDVHCSEYVQYPDKFRRAMGLHENAKTDSMQETKPAGSRAIHTLKGPCEITLPQRNRN